MHCKCQTEGNRKQFRCAFLPPTSLHKCTYNCCTDCFQFVRLFISKNSSLLRSFCCIIFYAFDEIELNRGSCCFQRVFFFIFISIRSMTCYDIILHFVLRSWRHQKTQQMNERTKDKLRHNKSFFFQLFCLFNAREKAFFCSGQRKNRNRRAKTKTES